MKNIFTQHPHSLNETYFEHFTAAMSFGLSMVIGGLACMTHAIFPFLFAKTGSNYLFKMTHRFVSRMPQVEDRFIMLSQCIEEKRCGNKIETVNAE